MSEVVRALGDRGVTRLRLDVVAANVRSITFYRRLGTIPLAMHPTPSGTFLAISFLIGRGGRGTRADLGFLGVSAVP